MCRHASRRQGQTEIIHMEEEVGGAGSACGVQGIRAELARIKTLGDPEECGGPCESSANQVNMFTAIR